MDNFEQKDLIVIENQTCPICMAEKATLSTYEIDDPFAGPIMIYSIKCNACGYKSSDLEFLDERDPAEYKIDIESIDDLNIRIIKSGECLVKIPNIRMELDSAESSDGFISNVEGLLLRFKKSAEILKESEEDNDAKKKIKNVIKTIDDVLRGEKKITIKLIDKTGNSAIISEKAQVKKL